VSVRSIRALESFPIRNAFTLSLSSLPLTQGRLGKERLHVQALLERVQISLKGEVGCCCCCFWVNVVKDDQDLSSSEGAGGD